MKNYPALTLILFCFFCICKAAGQINAPATWCTKVPLTVSTSANATTYNWVFDTVNITPSAPSFTASSIPNGNPTFAVMVNDSGSWYAFVTNYNARQVNRLSFGSNPLGSYTTSTFGQYGVASTLEGIDVVEDKSTGNWHAFVVNGTHLVRLDFGNSLGNTSTATPMIFSSHLLWPHQFGIAQYGSQWIGFAANRNGNVTRFDFGNSPLNTPTATNLPSTGITNPCNFAIYNDGTNWYMLVTNLINASVTRLSFGTNIQNNSPSASNLGNPGGLLALPRSIAILTDCNQLYAYIQNENGTHIRWNFNGNINNTPSAQSLGNTGVSQQNAFAIYSYGGVKRVLMASYNQANIYRGDLLNYHSSAQTHYDPDTVATYTFTTAGRHYITLYTDKNSHNGTAVYCAPIDVFASDSFITDTTICQGDTLVLDASLSGGTSYLWNTGATTDSIKAVNQGKYWVTVSGSPCASSDTMQLSTVSVQVDLGNDTSVCEGASVILQNKGSVPGGTTYLWSTTATTPQIPATDSGKYWLQATNWKCIKADTLQMSFHPRPVADAGRDTSLCPYNVYQLNGSGGVGYDWYAATGGTVSNPAIANPYTTVLNNSNYYLEVTNVQGCKDTDDVSIQLLPVPVANAGTDTSVCPHINFQLNGNGGQTYHWYSTPGGTVSNPFIAGPSAIATTNGTYRLEVTNALGCKDTDDVAIQVLPVPVANAGADTTVCKNAEVQLNGSGGSIYQWTSTAGNTLNNTNIANPLLQTSMSDVLVLYVTNSAGCRDTDAVAVKVQLPPVAHAGRDTLVCAGDTIMLMGSGGISYLWTVSGSNYIDSPHTANPKVSIADSSAFHLVVFDALGCSDTADVTLDVIPFPAFAITPDSVEICEGKAVKLSAYGGQFYTWWTDNEIIGTGSYTIGVSPSATKVYYVSVTESQCQYADTLAATVNVIPTPKLSVTKTNDIECTKGSAVLTAEGAEEYRWSPYETLSDPESGTTTASPRYNTSYMVIGTNGGKCSDTSGIEVKVDGKGLIKIVKPNAFSPNNNGLNDCYKITLSIPPSKYELSIFNRWGNAVFSTQNMNDCWDGSYKGQPADIGTYYYYYRAESEICDWFEKGDIQLVR